MMVANSDKEHTKKIGNVLKKNEGFCPCSVVGGRGAGCVRKDLRSMVRNGLELGSVCSYKIIED